ncbi:hypothetical protein pb186bvf_002455 [Paramecium bursaria]
MTNQKSLGGGQDMISPNINIISQTIHHSNSSLFSHYCDLSILIKMKKYLSLAVVLELISQIIRKWYNIRCLVVQIIFIHILDIRVELLNLRLTIQLLAFSECFREALRYSFQSIIIFLKELELFSEKIQVVTIQQILECHSSINSLNYQDNRNEAKK